MTDTLEQLLYKTQRADAVGYIAGGISHDFNNRLNGIIGSANIIRMRAGDDSIKRYAADIVGICRSASTMIRDILALARHRPVSVTSVSAHDAVCAVVNLLECSLNKKIVFKKYLNAKRCNVAADAVQLQNVLLNLALNSKEAMPEEGGAVIFSTENENDAGNDTAGAGKGFLKITVSDTGYGLSEEAKARLFEPFFTTKEDRAGLGLAAALRLVKSMGGTIEVTNAEERGATAAVTLPLCGK